jgi:photosystem II stability/assembly factor-like uncharacterized protein
MAVIAPNCAQAQWQIETSNTTADLRGIHSIGNGVAWASGTNGTVLRTEDGGYVWQSCSVPPGAEHLDFRGVQGFDANTAIVMSSGKGDLSRLYKTTDGCHTWKLIFTNPDADGFWDAIRFSDREQSSPDSSQEANGVLLGDPVDGVFAVFITTNGGDSWTRWNENDPKHLPKAANGESLFAASNQAAVKPGSNGPFAFVTGGTETRIYLAQPHSPFDSGWWESLSSKSLGFISGPSAGAFAIAARRFSGSPFADFMVVGGDYSKPDSPGSAAFISSPRFVIGSRCFSRPNTPPHGYRSSVAYDAGTKSWITVGPNGTDISTDDGKNWRPVHPNAALQETPDADRNWNAISLPFVVGPHGRIGRLNPAALER